MKFKLKFFCALLLFTQYSLNAQGVHFTYFELAPQALNPALSGNFLGTYRVSAVYRDQFQNNTVNGFRTIEAGVDAPIIRGARKQDWIGFGVSMDRDTRGMFDFGDIYNRTGLSYHLSLDSKQTRVLSIGAQRVGVNRRLSIPTGTDLTTFQFQNGGKNDPDIEALRTAAGGGSQGSGDPKVERSFSDYVGGVTFSSKTKTSRTIVGFSLSQLLKMNTAISQTYDPPTKITAFGTYEGVIAKNLTIEPSIFMQKIGSAFEVSAHAMSGYKIKESSPLIMKGGLGLRTGTASAQFLIGADYNSIRAGFAYDMPITGYAQAPGIQNAFELAVSYIGTINKKPKVKPIVVCPRL